MLWKTHYKDKSRSCLYKFQVNHYIFWKMNEWKFWKHYGTLKELTERFKREQVCCGCYKTHRPSSAMSKGLDGFKFRVLESGVEVVQCQVISVKELVFQQGQMIVEFLRRILCFDEVVSECGDWRVVVELGISCPRRPAPQSAWEKQWRSWRVGGRR